MSNYLDASGVQTLWGKIKTRYDNVMYFDLDYDESDGSYTVERHHAGKAAQNVAVWNKLMDHTIDTCSVVVYDDTADPMLYVNVYDYAWYDDDMGQYNFIRQRIDLITESLAITSVDQYGVDSILYSNSAQRQLRSGIDIKTINGQSVLGSGNLSVGGDVMVSTTHAALVGLRNQSKLVPGMQYRITDYQCTTSTANTQSANHQFDIIVTADSSSTLNENARACLHAGDTYFSGCNSNLSAWELKYTIDNDSTRFSWANPAGKGVVYYMKDEWDNECPYDFKNIMFASNKWSGYAYTFSIDVDGGNYYDISTEQFRYENDEGGFTHTYGNVIKPWGIDEYLCDYGYHYKLNFIVFTFDYDREGVYCGIHSNSFGFDSHDMRFSYTTYCNVCGDNCYNLEFIGGVSSNIIGSYCYDMKFGERFADNVIGSGSNGIYGGEYCEHNSFGAGCHDIIFGTSLATSGLKSNYQNITFDPMTHDVHIPNESTSSYLMNVRVHQSASGSTCSSPCTIVVPSGRHFETEVAKDSSGNVRTFCMADLYTQLIGVDDALARING